MEWRLFTRDVGQGDVVIAINVEMIRLIYTDQEGRTALSYGGDYPIHVNESFEEVMDIINRGKVR